MVLATFDWWANLVLIWGPLVFSLVQTGTLIFTAVWAVRYTRETMEMRRAAREQADAANEQLKLAQQSFTELQADKFRASHPFFLIQKQANPPLDPAYATAYGKDWTLKVTNKGAPVYRVRVRCNAGSLTSYLVGNPNFYDRNETFDIHFVPDIAGKFPSEWFFEISYVTLLHQPNVARYRAVPFDVESLDVPSSVAVP